MRVKRPPVVGISGPARSGKDTVAQLLLEAGYIKNSFAEPLKRGLMAMFGFTSVEVNEGSRDAPIAWLDGRTHVRHMLQTLGTQWGRDLLHEEVWVRQWARERDAHPSEDPVVISDVRYESEADAIRQAGGVILHLDRPSLPLAARNPAFLTPWKRFSRTLLRAVTGGWRRHSSENGVRARSGDLTISNAGSIDDLRRQVFAQVFGVGGARS